MTRNCPATDLGSSEVLTSLNAIIYLPVTEKFALAKIQAMEITRQRITVLPRWTTLMKESSCKNFVDNYNPDPSFTSDDCWKEDLKNAGCLLN